MSTEQNGEDIHVKWDRQAPAIRAAQRGVLTIEDGRYSKTLELDPGQLQNGSVVYRRSTNSVRFRLQLFSGLRDTQTETVEWTEYSRAACHAAAGEPVPPGGDKSEAFPFGQR